MNNIWSVKNAKIPDSTKVALNGSNIGSNINFALRLNKLANLIGDLKFLFYKAKKKELQLDLSLETIEEVQNLHDKISRGLRKDGYYVEEFKKKIDWRMAIGLGSESVYETSMTLHHIYGIPYIPGQAVKGVTRSWFIQENFSGNEHEAFKDQLFCDVFGCPSGGYYQTARAGKVIFMDAFPIGEVKVKPDIINPHYGEYYRGNKPPGDYLQPVPVVFLTVEKGEFQFAIAVASKNCSHQYEVEGERTIQKLALDWVKKALQEHGIGAKTSVGYGYFK